MIRITDTRCDLQPVNSGWLFQSPLAGGGGILWQHHYRPYSLFILTSVLYYSSLRYDEILTQKSVNINFCLFIELFVMRQHSDA